jgi:hypothetical protein
MVDHEKDALRLGYVVVAHTRPGQVGRLVERLSRGGDRVYLHVDRRVEIAPFLRALGPAAERSSVELLPRVRCRWGGWGIVAATLAGLRAATRGSDRPDHLLLLSGLDYPIAPRDRLAEHLAASGGAIFTEAEPMPVADLPDGGGLDRLTRRYLRPARAWSLPNRRIPWWPERRLPAGLEPHHGSQFWCMPRDAAEWIRDELDRRPELERFWAGSFVADEHAIPSLLMSGPLRDRVAGRHLHHMRHPHGQSHPDLLRAEDVAELGASGAFLARKFDEAVHPGALDAVERELLDV